jgi:hypothetical protein
MDNKTIASTIWQQLKTLDANLCMCMGVQQLTVIEKGLQFKVNGLAFKGLVQITLTPADLYEIKFLKMKRNYYVNDLDAGVKKYVNLPEVVSVTGGVYAEDMPEILERTVEGRG